MDNFANEWKRLQDDISNQREMVRRIVALEKIVKELREDITYGKVKYPHGPIFAEIYDRLSNLEEDVMTLEDAGLVREQCARIDLEALSEQGEWDYPDWKGGQYE